MFKNEPKINIKDAETIIGPSVKVKGNFHGHGNIVVEGIVEGSIKTGSNLRVGEKAKILANIEAKNATIGGEVVGNVKVSGYLEITAGAKILGDIETSELSIERGAVVNGRCIMTKESDKSSEKKQ